MRALAGALVLLAIQAGGACAQSDVARAGPIEPRSNPCLIAKLNPKLGPQCEMLPVIGDADPAQRAAAHLKRAHAFIDLHDLRQARSEIDAGLAATPDDFDLLLLSARLAMSPADIRTTDTARAERDIRAAVRLRPSDSDARATFAVFLSGSASPEEGLNEFNAILKRDPSHEYSRVARAKLLQGFNRHREALIDLDALAVGPAASADHLRLRATSLMALDCPDEAIVDFTRVLTASPNDIIALTGRATAYEMIGADEQALADYDAILGPIGGQPRYALGGDKLGEYRQQRALLLARLKRVDDAAAEMISGLAAGRASVLRAQVFLRRNGFPDLKLEGRDSPELRSAVRACFGLQLCLEGIIRAIRRY